MNLIKARSFFMIERYLQLLPTTEEELTAGTPDPQFIIALNKRLNENADSVRTLLTEIQATNKHPIAYTDIMHWKARAAYMRSVGQAKAARDLERREALKEAKEADDCEEFTKGYKNFLNTEFNA
jgi:hypothetical protein